MLMNMDLFEPRHNGAQGAPAPAASPSDDSMLDQIRTLDAMGYLGNHADAGASDAGSQQRKRAPAGREASRPPRTARAIPSSQPSYDVEGPQP